MANLRSPNYPSLTLKEGYQRVKKVYDKEHTHPAPREVVAKDLGYAGLNGASLTVLGALARYGLLEKVGKGNLKVSSDAVSVLELDEGHPERFESLRRLAFAPPLFAELGEKFGNELPSDVNLKHFLIQQKGFLPKAADEVIRIYRENLELVKEVGEDYHGGTQLKDREKRPMPETKGQIVTSTLPTIHSVGRPTKGVHEFSFPLSFQRDVRAVVTIYGERLLRRDLEFLKRKVGDLLEGFEEEEASSVLRSATWKNKDHDQPVTVTGDLGKGPDGRKYFKIAESETGVPEDELAFEDAKGKGAA